MPVTRSCPALGCLARLDEMRRGRRTALKKTKTNYLNYAGDICWEIEFCDCLFVVIAIYCKQKRSKELSSLLHAQYVILPFAKRFLFCFCFSILLTNNRKEKRQDVVIFLCQ